VNIKRCSVPTYQNLSSSTLRNEGKRNIMRKGRKKEWRERGRTDRMTENKI
jgi:hypothetical protein